MLKTLVAMIAAASITAAAADAKPPSDRGKPDKDRAGDSGDLDVDINIVLGDDERRIVRDYYGSNCPPGLAKKNNGCLPPGVAKKRYEIGRRIPDDYDYLPDDLIIRLPRLDNRYGYRMIDGDLVVVALATMIVVDAIGLT